MRRQIDGQLNGRQTRFDPTLSLTTGFSEHPLAESRNQAGFFGDRDELTGRYHTFGLIVPA